MIRPKPYGLEPFDLARAMDGEPIVTRDGRKVRFLAYVPEHNECHRVVVSIEGQPAPTSNYEDGRYFHEDAAAADLFMAPKPKRTVWVNLYKRESDGVGPGWIESGAFYNQKDALSFKR